MLCTSAGKISTTWEFSLNERGTWYWRAIDRDTGVVIHQTGDFQTLFACVKDAERNGYRLPLEQATWHGIPV